jgi:xanthine dehydrogenase accessory factor
MIQHFGMTEAQLARLHGPVGLNIHAKTPAEIAVSIVAQIIAVKNAPSTTHITGTKTHRDLANT